MDLRVSPTLTVMGSSDSALLHQFVADCRAAATTDSAVVDIAQRLEALLTDPEAVADAAGPLPSPLPDVGLDETLYEDDDLTVMLVTTTPGIDQPPHDHAMAAIIGVFAGCEDQRFFVRLPTGLKAITGRSIETGAVLTLGRKSIHAISAPGPEPSRAVHVYLGRLATQDRSLFHPENFVEEPLTIDRYNEYCLPAQQPN